ncbi:hypothetical protein F5Y19DRAFT_209767 [Xylariaceae sp. FL1651]|nr:hypothetical protein F5Y19DRAFT_209767 [Xylariaceae sp. FL1651]
MSDNRRVKFSSSPPLKGVLKHHDPRDSGVGSSSSDHTSSSGNLDERFTVRDFDIQSNDVGALREALGAAKEKIDYWKGKYLTRDEEYIDARNKKRETELSWRDECDRSEKLEVRMKDLESALNHANIRIQEVEAERDDWSTRYYELHDQYTVVVQSVDSVMASGGSSDSSQRLERSRSHHAKKDSKELTDRMKERLNREQKSDSTSASRSSHNTDSGTSSKRPSRRLSVSASNRKPYVEKLPPQSSTSLASPRQSGSYTLTSADRTRGPNTDATLSSVPRRRQAGPSSHSASTSHREPGDYIQHPLPERHRRSS